jgi:putative membrane protein
MRLLIRWGITIVAVAVAAWIVPGISVDKNSSSILVFAAFAIILGLVNAIIRPILALLSCGCIALTLGLFMLVVNAVALWLASWIAVNLFHVGFNVDGLIPAFLGSIVISLVSWGLSMLFPDKD